MEYIINNRLSIPKEPSLWYAAYDRLGRVAYSGVTTDSRTAAQLQNAYGLSHYMAEFRPQIELGYPIFYENVSINARLFHLTFE